MSLLGYLVDPLRELLFNWEGIVRQESLSGDSKVICTPCDILSQEICAACGVLPIRIPSHVFGKDCVESAFDASFPDIMNRGICDIMVIPDTGYCRQCMSGDAGRDVYRLELPTGYGDESILKVHEAYAGFLLSISGCVLEELPDERLVFAAGVYGEVKRLVRGISSERALKPGCLSHVDMQVVFESAVCFPANLVLDHLRLILKQLNGIHTEADLSLPKVLVAGGFLGDGSVMDLIEAAGCLVVEDDSCMGRRQFDVSVNSESPSLYMDLLGSLVFRPLCPALRPVEERFDLFYRQLRNYGIELVVFIEDSYCTRGVKDMEYLRKKLMRSGVDPLIVRSSNAQGKVKEYISSVKL